jgi:Holliday junction DNA helicase RuvA
MIGFLEGSVLKVGDRFVIINTSGVGYKVFCDIQKYMGKVGQTVQVFIHTVVREDALELFGFELEEDLQLFEKLISISGIGPRAGLQILTAVPSQKLFEAIESGNVALLTSIQGIGKKTAEKIVLELRGAISDLQMSNKDEEVIMALKSLGYSERDAMQTMKNLDMKDATTEEKLKKALKYLGK